MRMRVVPILILLAILFCGVLFAWPGTGPSTLKKARDRSSPVALKDGDIVFQYSGSQQCPAIAQATHSPYTHCGILMVEHGVAMVWEAVGPVLKTPYADWVRHGVDGHVVVKRLSDTTLISAPELEAMKAEGELEMGRPYDIYFSLDDERIYCSELVYKMYLRGADIRIGAVQRFADFDLSGNHARRVLHDRFGDHFPADREVVTPASIFASPLLYTVDSIGAPPPIPAD